MPFFVVGSDGNQYGPADEPTLKLWATEGRLHPESTLKNAETGETLTAASVNGIFPSAMMPPPAMALPPVGSTAIGSPSAYAGYQQPYAAYPRTIVQPSGSHPGKSLFWNAVIRSLGGLVLFFLFHGLGVIWAGYALYYAIRCNASGHPRGVLAIAIAAFCLVLVILGWILRIGGAGV